MDEIMKKGHKTTIKLTKMTQKGQKGTKTWKN